MDEDRERGRIASTATKRQASIDHAKATMPALHEAFRTLRTTDRGASLRAVAEYLNTRTPPLQTLKGATFGAESVRRMLNNTEKHIEKAAAFECYVAVQILRHKAKLNGIKPDASEIAALEAKRDADIEEGKVLGRRLRLEEEIPPDELTIEQAAQLVIHQYEHRRRRREWDDTKDYPLDGFDAWAVEVLKKACSS